MEDNIVRNSLRKILAGIFPDQHEHIIINGAPDTGKATGALHHKKTKDNTLDMDYLCAALTDRRNHGE